MVQPILFQPGEVFTAEITCSAHGRIMVEVHVGATPIAIDTIMCPINPASKEPDGSV